jgi:release factor glutamine methyltransferase
MAAPASLIAQAAKRLASLPNAELDAELLFRGIAGLTRAEFLAQGDEPVDSATAARFEAAVDRRERHEPIQYILGVAAFWRDEFVVTPAVLIPRPDTEVLVEAVAGLLRTVESPRLLDLGTGSGCIALSLLRELPSAKAMAVDLSEEALAVARGNAERLNLERRIQFRRSRWFDAIPGDETFAAIVSNPPYVARADAAALPTEVRDFEPALALFAEPNDDLSSYRAIVAGLGARLRSGGWLALEVGQGQAAGVAAILATTELTSIKTVNDLASIPRVVLGRRL